MQTSKINTMSVFELAKTVHASNWPATPVPTSLKLKLLYDWQSVSQYVLVSGTPLGPMTRFYFPPPLFFLAGKLLCSSSWGALFDQRTGLQFVLQSASGQNREELITHTLLSHLRLLGSLSVAWYDSQGLWWKYSYPPPHGDYNHWTEIKNKDTGHSGCETLISVSWSTNLGFDYWV
jgi:hypothetical protein